MAGYDQLFSTCTRALPAEPLLRALVVCSANPPDPCFEVDCGEHGSCDGGTCQCEQGYSGVSCAIFDPCDGVDCGGHGHCVGGSCHCEASYSGSRCANLREEGVSGIGGYHSPCRCRDGTVYEVGDDSNGVEGVRCGTFTRGCVGGVVGGPCTLQVGEQVRVTCGHN
eukprot:SAG31_NODE_1095_length_9928_cov_5.441042_4_plen_167_part_00